MDRIIEVKVSGNHLSKDNKNAGVRGEANATQLRITFDEGWNAYKSKKVTFWDARGLNPVECTLGIDKLENALKSDKIYIIPIPEEPLAEAGMLTFVIDGYSEGKRQRSISDQLMVKDAPIADNAGEPADPTATPTEQLQVEIEKIKGTIIDAIAAKEGIENMGVSVETLEPGEEAYVKKYTQYLPEENIEVAHLHFGIPKGNAGDSGVHIGKDEPTDPAKNIWIEPNGSATDYIGYEALMTSIKAYGAAGDGVTDDTEALKAAASSGEAVFFPAGTYLLSEGIIMTADINWYGEGEKSIIKRMPYGQSTVMSRPHLISDESGKHSINLQGIVFDANKEGCNDSDEILCLYLRFLKKVRLDNVECVNAKHCGCYIQDAGEATINNCRFNDNGKDGLSIVCNSYKQGIISNCDFNNNIRHGLVCSGDVGANISNISCCNNSGSGVILAEGTNLNTLLGVRCCGNAYGVMLKAGYDANIIEDGYYGDGETDFAENNTIIGLITENNDYGVVFCNCDKTIINGWNCVKDTYAYCIGCLGAERDITGMVFGIFDYIEGEKYCDTGNVDIFKIQFTGR